MCHVTQRHARALATGWLAKEENTEAQHEPSRAEPLQTSRDNLFNGSLPTNKLDRPTYSAFLALAFLTFIHKLKIKLTPDREIELGESEAKHKSHLANLDSSLLLFY